MRKWRWASAPGGIGQLGLEEAALDGERDSLGAILGAELLEEGGDVELGRALGNAEGASDLLVRLAVGHQPQHLALAWAEAAVRRAGRAHLPDQARGDPRREVSVARGDRAHAPRDLVG